MAYIKEGTVIILDVGKNMKEIIHEGESALKIALQCTTRILQNKLFTESKDEFALILVGSDETDNRLATESEDRFQNLKTATDMQLVNWEMMEAISDIKEPSDQKGDMYEALKLAVDIHHQDNKNSKRKRFGSRRVMVLSNFQTLLNASHNQLAALADDFGSCGVESIQLIGCDLDNVPQEDGIKHAGGKMRAPKPITLVNYFVDELVNKGIITDKESYSFEEAVEYTSHFTTRVVRPAPWKATLTIGDTLKIPVVAYSKVKPAKQKQNWKKAFAQDTNVDVQRATGHFIQSGLDKKEIDKEDLIDGYRFGSTVVPFSDADKAAMKYDRLGKRLDFLCFADRKSVGHDTYVGDDVKVVTAVVDDHNAAKAISALMQACLKEDKVIIAVYGYNAVSSPKMVSLSPHKCESGNYEGFYMHFLPFLEDIRLSQFPSLDADLTDEQLEAVDQLLDDLTIPEDDPMAQDFTVKKIQNPYLQKLYSSLAFRALHPDEPLPDDAADLLKHLVMPKELAERSMESAERVKELFPMKKVEKKAAKKGLFAEKDGAAAGAAQDQQDAEAAKGPVITEVGTVSPAENFRIMSDQLDSPADFSNVFRKGEDVVNQLIFRTFDGFAYAGKVILLIQAMREYSIKYGAVDIFNDFLTKFRTDLLDKRQHDVWKKLVDGNITLISEKDTPSSKVTAQAAASFLAYKTEEQTEKKPEPKADEDDVFSEMFE